MKIPPETAALFIERFPKYGLLLSEWQNEKVSDIFRPATQKKWLKSTLKSNLEIIYLYRIGDGRAVDLLSDWLKENSKRRLVFLEPSGGRIAQFLREPFAFRLLNLNQVEIVHLPSKTPSEMCIWELARNYLSTRIEVACAPGLLAHERRGFKQIRLNLLCQTNYLFGYAFEKRFQAKIFGHVLYHLRKTSQGFCFEKLKGAFKNVPAIICGAGPSLAKSIETIKTLEDKALIIAAGSAISILGKHGIIPHFNVAVDPNDEEFDRFKGISAFETPLLFFPRLYPKICATLNGPLGCIPSEMSGGVMKWLQMQIGLQEFALDEELPPEAISVTQTAVAAACYFECNPILLDGIDMAYTDQKRYAEGASHLNLLPSQKGEGIDQPLKTKDRHGKSILSAVRWAIEAKGFNAIIKKHSDRRWVNCTQGGLGLAAAESIPLDQIIEELDSTRDLRGEIHSLCSLRATNLEVLDRINAAVEKLLAMLQSLEQKLKIALQSPHRGERLAAEIEIEEEEAYVGFFQDAEWAIRASFGLSPSKLLSVAEKLACREAMLDMVQQTMAELLKMP